VLKLAFERCMTRRPRIETYSGREPSEAEKTAICRSVEVDRLLRMNGIVVIVRSPQPTQKCSNPDIFLEVFRGTIYVIQPPCGLGKIPAVASGGTENGG
jgi:hypothetical protein